MERVAVYIDGSNFYFKARSFGVYNTQKFDYLGLAKKIAGERECISLRYYIGVVKAKYDDQKGQELRKGQQKLFSHLRNQGFIIKKGYLMQNNNKFHEKGVDVKLAVDLLVGAYENIYDTAILISSDTDLIPAISKVKHLDKKIEYVGFSHQPSLGMQKYANLSRLLTKEDLEPFTCKTLF